MAISNAQLVNIIRIQSAIAGLGFDLSAIINLVCAETLGLLGVDGAAVELTDGQDMVYRAASGIAAGQLGLRLPLSGSLSGLSVTSGSLLMCGDSESDARVNAPACRAIGLRSMLVAPLRHDGQTVGVLKAMARAPHAFGPDETELLGLLTDALAAAIHFATRFDMATLLHKATHDDLTGLPNRALFMEQLRAALGAAARRQRPVGVVLIDMDGLKTINDRLGHQAGDAALSELARRLRGITREQELAARLGGDEFTLLLADDDVGQGLPAVLGRVAGVACDPVPFAGHALPLSFSAGAALSPDDGTEPAALIARADQRMYAAKRRRRAARTE